MDWLEEVNNQEDKTALIFSFNEYMEIFNENPKRELRTTAMYLMDMFNHFGVDENGGFKLFKKDHPGAPAVAGQRRVQQKIYQNLVKFSQSKITPKAAWVLAPSKHTNI